MISWPHDLKCTLNVQHCIVTELHIKCDKILTNRLMPTVIGKSAFSSTAKFQALTLKCTEKRRRREFLKIELPFKVENIFCIHASTFFLSN